MNAAAAQRLAAAEWLELSGLPLALNEARGGAWSVFKKIVELDCARNETPAAVEVAPEELAMRCGLSLDKLAKIIETLRKQKVVRAYWPDHAQEPALLEIITPLATPEPAEAMARRMDQPLFRHVDALRYAKAVVAAEVDEDKLRQVVDWYLARLSQKMNHFVLEQIEIAVRHFPLEAIREMIERAERHNLRNFGWVLKELYKEAARGTVKKK